MLTLKLRPDLVLVKLPPARTTRKVDLITTDLDTFLAQTGIVEFQRLLPMPKVDDPGGIVVGIGKSTTEVWPGDRVLLEPEAGQPVDLPDPVTGLPHPHLIVREADITCVLERT